MISISIINNKCPFCNSMLRDQIVKCPESIILECKECQKCKKYFYNENYYNLLEKLANKYGRKINSRVYLISKVYSQQTFDKYTKRKKNKKSKIIPVNNYDCIYHINGKCFYKYQKSRRLKECIGKLHCDNYTYSSPEQFGIKIFTQNNKINILIIICQIQMDSFLNDENKILYFFRNTRLRGKSVYLHLSFDNSISYDLFCKNEIKNMKIKNHKLLILLDNPLELQKIMMVPFRKIKKYIAIPFYFYEMGMESKGQIIISKEKLFHSIKSNTKTDENRKQYDIENKSNNEDKNTTIKKKVEKRHIVTVTKKEVGVSVIVLSENKKCLYNEHDLFDVSAKIRIVISSGKIIDYFIPAAYCSQCDKFYCIKSDFNIAKKRGVILCPIENEIHIASGNTWRKTASSNESKIHQMGYNVQKNFDYTVEQRRVILANIIENTNITKHEIQSLLNRFIHQHQKQKNYALCVSKWREDLEFISSYKKGDIPEVIVNNFIVKHS